MTAAAGVAAAGHPLGEGAGQDEAGLGGLGDLRREAGGAGLLGRGWGGTFHSKPRKIAMPLPSCWSSGKPGEALSWVERGIRIDTTDPAVHLPESNSYTYAVSCS